jgi:2-oxoglutarate ferredoxin oxidoreductase subunit beta
MAEMLSTLDGCAYAERVTVVDPASIAKAKRAIKKAFTLQLAGAGFTMVELLSICPTNWGLSPIEAVGWLKENMLPVYPLGVYTDKTVQKEETTR